MLELRSRKLEFLMGCRCSNIPQNLKIIKVGNRESGIFDQWLKESASHSPESDLRYYYPCRHLFFTLEGRRQLND